MCYIPDPVERLEAWEDRAAAEYTDQDGNLTCCGCGKVIEPGQCHQVGVAPYGLPACERCFHEAYR